MDSRADMPPPAPLQMRVQNLRTKPHHPHETSRRRGALPWRLGLFVPALIGTALMIWGMHSWLSNSGLSSLEWALLAMIGATFVWVTLSVSTIGVAIAGLTARSQSEDRAPQDVAAMDAALLVPVYNEVPWDVFGNASAMLNDLARRGGPHRYALFILSDTQDPDIVAQEWQAFQQLRAEAPAGFAVHYRRRLRNTDKKVGNIVDWVTGWGAAFDGMVVLDADSLMTGRAIERLCDELSADKDAGLIQSFPMLIGARTLFARLQQFSNIAYGWLLAEGLSLWSRSEGNYWGHNAIIRTRAFAESAGLPHLKSGKRRDLILSHDFVEAGLLRRAGWRVRFLPRVTGSFEETPATLIDHALRDRRWCRGNLQHLRLLGTRGMHPVSRYHLFHGAMGYLLSPAWFILLIFWTLLGKDESTNVVRYFNEANPLFPDWPPEMSHIDSAIFLVIMYAMLLTPKLVAGAMIVAAPGAAKVYGGHRAFMAALFVEVLLSVAYAPILMIQQTKAVFRAILTRSEPWSPQRRDAAGYGWGTLMRFHWLETAVGVLLLAGLVAGLVSLWLLPIMASLLLAVPLSWLSSFDVVAHAPRALRMESPHTLREPAILRRAMVARSQFKSQLHGTSKVPAE